MAAAVLSIGATNLHLAVSQAAPGRASITPVLARTAVVSPLGRGVLVRAKGGRRFTVLTRPRQIPLGSTVDATRGRVKLLTAGAASATTQSGEFSGGAFTVFQERSALTDLRLVGGHSQAGACPLARSRTYGGARSALSTRVIRLLRGRAHGRFRTVGQYTSAAVRGTVWETVDRCDGTLTVDDTGTVETTTGTQTFALKPGQSAIAYCFPPTNSPQARDYCILELSQPANGLFGFALGIRMADTAYDLCIQAPSGTVRCRPFALSAPDATGIRTSAVVCVQDEGPGHYIARWLIAGQPVGIPLPFTATIPRPSVEPPCVSQP